MGIAQSHQSARGASRFKWLGWTLRVLAYVGSGVVSTGLIWFAGSQLFH